MRTDHLQALALAASLLPALASAVPTAEILGNGVRLPLFRKSHGFEYIPGHDHSARFAKRDTTDIEIFMRHQMDIISSKYGTSNSTAKRLTRRAGTEAFYNSGYDAYYYGPVTVGGVDYNAVLDTGSSDFWLANSQCGSSCSGAKLFDTTASNWQSSNAVFEIAYGTGETAGTLGTANLGMAGYNLTGQSVASCNEVSSNIVDENVSGIMGFAFSTISSAGTVPFWQQLVQKNMLPSPLFAVQLSRSTSTVIAQNLPGGSFTIGALDSSVYTGSINNISVANPGYWEIPMNGISVNGQAISINTPQVAIDTGTSLVAGPTAAISAIYAAIPGSQALTGSNAGSYVIPCSTTVTIALTFGSTSYTINPTDLIAGQLSTTECMGGFIVNPVPADQIAAGVPAWILGDVFMKNVYTVFQASPAQVGFASLSNSADTTAGATTSAAIPAASVTTRGPVVSGATTRSTSTVTATAGTSSSSGKTSSSTSSLSTSSTTVTAASVAVLSTLIAQTGAPSTFLTAALSTPSAAATMVVSAGRLARSTNNLPFKLAIVGVMIGAILIESLSFSDNA